MMTQLELYIRWMLRIDMERVLEIERQSFEFPWTEEDYLLCLRQRNCIGMVAEHGGKVVGVMLYELLPSQLHVLNFAVCPIARRRGVGTQMVAMLVHKLSKQRRQQIFLEVRETNLAAQQFFSKQGFIARGVLRDHYEDTDEDAYVMRYSIGDEQPSVFVPQNRIAEFLDD